MDERSEAFSEAAKKLEESSLKGPVCRICYEPEKENNLLIHPCRCMGSVRFIHEECMKTWLLSTNEDLNNRACEVCHTTLKMEYKIVSYVSCNDLCDETFGACLFIPILAAILGLISVIIYFLALKYNASDTSKQDQIYALSLIIGCSLAGIIIVIILGFIFKSTFVKSKMKYWKILSQEFKNENNEGRILEKIDDDHTLFTHPNENNVLIIPKTTKICGKKIKTPKVQPITLVPVINHGKIIGYRNEENGPFVQSCFVKSIQKSNSNRIVPINDVKQNITL